MPNPPAPPSSGPLAPSPAPGANSGPCSTRRRPAILCRSARRAREELLAFDACLEESLRELVLELQRPAPDIRRLEPVWAAWRREAARQWAEAGDRCRVFDHPDAAPPSASSALGQTRRRPVDDANRTTARSVPVVENRDAGMHSSARIAPSPSLEHSRRAARAVGHARNAPRFSSPAISSRRFPACR